MTRESKLALIIGFVLILVVGVLVSDHLSQASSATIDPNSGLEQPQPIAHLPNTETQRTRLDTSIERATPAPQIRHPLAPEQADDPIIISQSPARRTSLFDQVRDTVKTIRDTETPMLAATKEQARGAIPNRAPRTYTVDEGDSLYAIARETLGDGNRWTQIHRLNHQLLGPDPILQPGMVLTLPDGAILSEARRPSPARDEPRKGSEQTYTVQSGDALSMIAQELLGSSKRASEIAELNGLKDLDDIRIGMVLKVPAR